MRKRVYAKRPSRNKGTPEWLARQMDKDGFQERTLRLAYDLYHDIAERLAICQAYRRTGKQHEHLPLKRSKSKGPCSASECFCKAHYLILAAKDMGIATGKPDFVSAARRASAALTAPSAALASAALAAPSAALAASLRHALRPTTCTTRLLSGQGSFFGVAKRRRNSGHG